MVSVIMPFLDPPEPFFREAIQSIENQSCANWELILVDDGSTSASTNIAVRSAEARPGRIRYIDHDGHRNLGISASRNLGIGASRGEFVAFLDADDLWDPKQLEEQLALLQQHSEASMLYGNTLYWSKWQNNPDSSAEDVRVELGVPLNQVIQPPTILRLILARKACPPCMTATIVRRSIFDDGIEFEESFPVHYEDQVFMAKVALQYPIFVSDRMWGRYRQHAGSVTAAGDNSDFALEWRLKYLKWMSEYFAENDVKDRKLKFLLWLEIGMLRNRLISLAARFYRLWRGRLRRVLARLRGR